MFLVSFRPGHVVGVFADIHLDWVCSSTLRGTLLLSVTGVQVYVAFKVLNL